MIRIFLLCFMFTLALSGCSNKIKEKVGFATSGPDEYMVLRGKGLEIPPTFDNLPTPQEGDSATSYTASDRKLDNAEEALLQEVTAQLAK